MEELLLDDVIPEVDEKAVLQCLILFARDDYVLKRAKMSGDSTRDVGRGRVVKGTNAVLCTGWEADGQGHVDKSDWLASTERLVCRDAFAAQDPVNDTFGCVDLQGGRNVTSVTALEAKRKGRAERRGSDGGQRRSCPRKRRRG